MAQRFADWLTGTDAERRYGLPTEWEWEYVTAMRISSVISESVGRRTFFAPPEWWF
ncbi:MAG: hypothetical protein R3C02_10470 [Planctomycetaceae bacterium]